MNINESMMNITTIQSSSQIQAQRPNFNMEHQKDENEQHYSKDISKEQVQETVDTLNEFLKPTRHHLQFELHEELERYFVSVVNPETDEIIREIPPKKMLDMYAKMAEYMGFLVDEKI